MMEVEAVRRVEEKEKSVSRKSKMILGEVDDEIWPESVTEMFCSHTRYEIVIRSAQAHAKLSSIQFEDLIRRKLT